MKKKLHPTGQLSIFAIIIFQALFIVFALALNIALVVHDKINLQNSVDMAAYYGAMKQAQMLNTIAHVNYQIRQSWKLLSWRYYVLGNMSITDGQGVYRRCDRANTIESRFPDPKTIGGGSGTSSTCGNPGPFFICLGHSPKWWNIFEPSIGGNTSSSDMLCRAMLSSIPALPIPVLGGTLGGYSSVLQGIASLTAISNLQISDKCEIYGVNSWLLGIYSFLAFRNDQDIRRQMIEKLGSALASGKDIEGNNIETGVRKTFEKNLSFINRNNAPSLQVHNSTKSLSSWKSFLHRNKLQTKGYYADIHGGNIASSCTKEIAHLGGTAPQGIGPAGTSSSIQQYINTINHIDNGTAGGIGCSGSFFKKDNMIIFYSVKAEIPYNKQIFFPFINQQIRLKAEAFAKPFGGTIGPKYDGGSLCNDDGPNYRRFTNDQNGLISHRVFRYWTQYLRSSPAPSKSIFNYKQLPTNTPITAINPAHEWEIAAIAPDKFDIENFTILPNYHTRYFGNVQNLVGMPDARSELNSPRGVIEQIRILPNIGRSYRVDNKKWLLTGWSPTGWSLGNYGSPPCNGNSNWSNNKIANGCIFGARAGYSVKLFSKDLFSSSTPDYRNTPVPW